MNHSIVSFNPSLIFLNSNSGRELIIISEIYFRPCEVDELLGDSTKTKEKLGWECKYDFNSLVNEMVNIDCKNIHKISKN